MYRYEIINKLIKNFNFQHYLEIGVYSGQCIRNIIAPYKDGVDPGTEGQSVEEVNYKMTSDMFFSTIKNSYIKYDIIFIDGLHHSTQVDVDIKNSLLHLNDGGFIVLHDCNPEKEIYTKVPRISDIWHGDVYKSVLKFRKNKLHSIFTVDTDCGCGVIRKDNRVYEFDETEFDKAIESWDYFYENKGRLLNLISVEDFNLMYENI